MTAGALALAAIVVMAGLLYATTRDGSDAALSADESVTRFADLCTTNVISRGAMEHEITADQINSACKCLGEDFRDDLTGMTADGVSAFLDSAPGNQRMKASATRCFQRAGMDFQAE